MSKCYETIKRKNYLKISFSLFFLLFLINILLYQSNIIKSLYFYIVLIFFFCIKLFFMKYNKFEIFILFLFFLISIISRNPKLLLIFIAMIYLKKINIESVSKKYFYLGILIFLLIVFLAKIDVIDTKNFVYSSTKIRNGLGFKNPNTPGIYYFILVSHFYFFKWEYLRIKHSILIFAGYLILYMQAMSRSNILVGLLQIFIVCFWKNRLSIERMKKYYFLIPVIGYIFSVLIMIVQPVILNKLMSSRPLTWRLNFLEKLNFINILFGNLGREISHPLDNGFLSMQFHFGLFAVLIVLYFLSIGLKKMDDKYIERSFLLLVPYIIYSLSEDMLIGLNFGLIPIFIMSRVFLYKNVSKNENFKERRKIKP